MKTAFIPNNFIEKGIGGLDYSGIIKLRPNGR